MADQKSYNIKIVTGGRLDKNGCPYCKAKTGRSELFRKRSELQPEFQPCDNVYRHTCGECNKVCIGISGITLPGFREEIGLPPYGKIKGAA